MEFSEEVYAKGKGGKLEVRAVDSRGQFVLCKYLDPKTMKLADNKRKLCLKDEDGNILEYFIIPLKTKNRSLLVATDKEEKERKVWNEKTGVEEDLWK